MPSQPLSRPANARVGLFGGTFDPPHVGHLAAALTVRDALHLDRVDFLPANDPWQKTSETDPDGIPGARHEVTPAALRLEMVRALVGSTDGLGVDDREIRRGGVTYTVDTLEDIHRETPGVNVYLIIGADTARRFHTWHRHEEVASLSTLVVVNRAHETPIVPSGASHAEFVTMTPVDVSSTIVRQTVARGGEISSMVPPAVAAVIARHGLYGSAL